MIVNDILSPWRQSASDPFLLWHEFGPMPCDGMPPIGMHPHRGFNEVPYLKKGRWMGVDHWNPEGEDQHPLEDGMVQWGKVGSGIEHGVKFDPTYAGEIHGFQLWVNLPAAQKLDPPHFQDACCEALPEEQLNESVKSKLLVGSCPSAATASPIDTGGARVQYVDFMLEPGGEWNHPFPEGMRTAFLYVYEGTGRFGANGQIASKGQIMKVEPGETLMMMADQGDVANVLFIAGQPLEEPIIQHGPFVMSSKEQIMQAFQDYQRGALCNDTCSYTLHRSAGDSVHTERSKPHASRFC